MIREWDGGRNGGEDEDVFDIDGKSRWLFQRQLGRQVWILGDLGDGVCV